MGYFVDSCSTLLYIKANPGLLKYYICSLDPAGKVPSNNLLELSMSLQFPGSLLRPCTRQRPVLPLCLVYQG